MNLPRLITILFTMLLVNSALATSNNENIIEVTGQAKVYAQPDNFSLNLALVQTGRNLTKIRQLVDYKSNQIIKIAYSLGLDKDRINSARVVLRVIKNHNNNRAHVIGVEHSSPSNKAYVAVDSSKVEQSKMQNFELSRSISVQFNSIDDYDKFLAKVISVGVERISPLSISISNPSEYYQQALDKAIANAKQKALQIAKQLDVSLGKTIYLKELSNNHYAMRSMAAESFMQSPNTHQSQVAKQAITASVLVKFAIQP